MAVNLTENTQQVQVLEQIVQLFRNAPDLLAKFKAFLPTEGLIQATLLELFVVGDHQGYTHKGERLTEKALSRKKDKGDGTAHDKPVHLPQKRKRKPVEKEPASSKVSGSTKV